MQRRVWLWCSIRSAVTTSKCSYQINVKKYNIYLQNVMEWEYKEAEKRNTWVKYKYLNIVLIQYLSKCANTAFCTIKSNLNFAKQDEFFLEVLREILQQRFMGTSLFNFYLKALFTVKYCDQTLVFINIKSWSRYLSVSKTKRALHTAEGNRTRSGWKNWHQTVTLSLRLHTISTARKRGIFVPSTIFGCTSGTPVDWAKC